MSDAVTIVDRCAAASRCGGLSGASGLRFCCSICSASMSSSLVSRITRAEAGSSCAETVTASCGVRGFVAR